MSCNQGGYVFLPMAKKSGYSTQKPRVKNGFAWREGEECSASLLKNYFS